MAEYTFRATQDPDAVLDWTIDWSSWLESGETITDASWEPGEADLVTLSDDVFGSTTATVFVSELTSGQYVDVTCHIVTSNSPAREDDRTIRFIGRSM